MTAVSPGSCQQAVVEAALVLLERMGLSPADRPAVPHAGADLRGVRAGGVGGKEEWLAARLEDLDYGDIDGIVTATRQYPLEGVKKDEIQTALGYFENNAPRMRYHWFRQCGLFVGSGLVEAGCKSVIGHRFKRAGMQLDRQRRRRHRHPPLPARQPTRRPDLATTPQPDRGRQQCPLNDLGHLQKWRTQDLRVYVRFVGARPPPGDAEFGVAGETTWHGPQFR